MVKIILLTIFMVISCTTARPKWLRQYGGNSEHLLSENDYIDERANGWQRNEGDASHLLSENDHINERPNQWRRNGDASHLLSENDYIDETPWRKNSRHRRQAHGVMNTNPDGTANIMAKLPLAGNENNVLSGISGITGLKPSDSKLPGNSYSSVSGGLALDNVNGHGLSLTGKHIPDFGNQLTAAGKLNMIHNDNHDLTANAFATRNMPSNPLIPNFNTYGGGVDYTFRDKVGASLGMAHTPLTQRTDYSAMGNFNLFKDRTSSLDLNAGYTKSISPFIPSRSWEPSFGLSFSKYF